MAGVKGLYRALGAVFYCGAEVSLFVQKFRQSKTLGFGYSSRQGAAKVGAIHESPLLSFRPLGEIFLRSLAFARLCENTSEPFDRAQGERISVDGCYSSFPFVPRYSKHERIFTQSGAAVDPSGSKPSPRSTSTSSHWQIVLDGRP